MHSTYAQTQKTAQKKEASTAAAVLDASSQNEGLQRKADMANGAAQREEAPRPNNTGMPDNLKSGIESLSGFSMDDVRVHYNSSKPATVQALAYTQGTDIHVAPGQEKHLPHEAWHVAQQMAGRVSPTTNINGMPVNDNAALEHEADVMGEKAVQCKMVGEKSLESKEKCDKVIQCSNHPAFFKTENDEGCPYSRYYVFADYYVRIAPINTRRAPTQEYHKEERNFVYFKDYAGCNVLKYYYNNRPDIMKQIEDLPIDKNFKLHGQTFTKKPKSSWSPFDWNERSHHPGHPIDNPVLCDNNDAVSTLLLQKERNIEKYEERNKYALEFLLKHHSEEEFLSLNKEYDAYKQKCIEAKILPKNFDNWLKYRMEAYFTDLWDCAVKLDKFSPRKKFDSLNGNDLRDYAKKLAEQIKLEKGILVSTEDLFDELSAKKNFVSVYFASLPKFGSEEFIDEDEDPSFEYEDLPSEDEDLPSVKQHKHSCVLQ